MAWRDSTHLAGVGGVVDEADVGEAVEDALADLLGDALAGQGGVELGTRLRRDRQPVQHDRPGHRLGIGVGPGLSIARRPIRTAGGVWVPGRPRRDRRALPLMQRFAQKSTGASVAATSILRPRCPASP